MWYVLTKKKEKERKYYNIEKKRNINLTNQDYTVKWQLISFVSILQLDVNFLELAHNKQSFIVDASYKVLMQWLQQTQLHYWYAYLIISHSQSERH